MPRQLDIFVGYLRKKNLKMTGQRKRILDVFLKTDRHLSVEDLYEMVKRGNPRIGRATVFRTLKILCEADIARQVDLGDKLIRYEHKYGHYHHDHLVCIKCGRLIETVDPRIEKLQNELCKRFNFLPRHHKMEIFGICRNCK